MEYRSSASFLGWPLVHVAIGGAIDGHDRRGIATARFAAGRMAIGGVASARSVTTPPASRCLRLASIPRAPFDWSDALLLTVQE